MTSPAASSLLGPVRTLLPHPPVDVKVFLTVHRALARAMELLRQMPLTEFDVTQADEDAITKQLELVLESRLRLTGEVRGFDRRRFGPVRREPKVTNFNGQSPDRMPDLVFHLKPERLDTLSTHDAIFAECKPVHATRAAGAHYCDRGIVRFIDGDYAWAMQDALMVAYVRDGRTIHRHLCCGALDAIRRNRLRVHEQPGPVQVRAPHANAEPLHRSRHGRSFSWPDGREATEMNLYHSWLRCL
jgi:hypothetical protein